MVNVRTPSPRRREVRRKTPRPGPAWVRFLRRRDVGWSALFAAVFTLLAGGAVVWIGQRPRRYLGEVITHPIVSRVAFQHEDQIRTREARRQARENQPGVYTVHREYARALRERLGNLLALADYPSFEQVPLAYRRQVDLTSRGLSDLKNYVADKAGLQRWNHDTDQFLQTLFGLAVVTPKRYQADRGGSIEAADSLKHSAGDAVAQRGVVFPPSKLYSVEHQKLLAAKLVGRADAFPPALRPTVVALVMNHLRPTYQFAPHLTEAARRQAARSVRPAQVSYHSNQVLVQPGETLGSSDLELLRQEEEAFAASRSTLNRFLAALGRFGVVLLIALGLWSYIFAYKHRIVENPMRGLALVSLLVLCQLLAVALTQWQPVILYITAIFPTLMAVMVLTIVYEQRFALAVGGFHVMLIMVSLNLPIGFGIVLLTGVGVAVAMLREVRTRSKLMVVGLWSGGAMALATLATSLAARRLDVPGELNHILTQNTPYVLVTGFFVGVIVQGVLPAIERIFKVTTAMTLKELNDASHPLLQRLAQEASGTYQHSLRIADMAEAAAEAIGADGLLCRVGAMYHDIGKINKPQYFIENQGGGPNRHSKLSPAMSLLIIVGHVKDGVEMAREFGLPPSIRQFIETHHGTTLVEYFYHAARKQKQEQEQELPSEFEFRYPGPKPQTKETAILLLCDSIEAAARTLAEPTPIRIEQLVHMLANKRLMDGQFDQSTLTLQDLYRIEQAIIKTLNAIYHARIKYPTAEQQPTGSAQVSEQAPTAHGPASPERPADQPARPGGAAQPAVRSAAS